MNTFEFELHEIQEKGEKILPNLEKDNYYPYPVIHIIKVDDNCSYKIRKAHVENMQENINGEEINPEEYEAWAEKLFITTFRF